MCFLSKIASIPKKAGIMIKANEKIVDLLRKDWGSYSVFV